MKKGLVLLGALLMLAAVPSATVAQKAKGGPQLVGDALSQVFVPFQSLAAKSAAPAKAKKAKRMKRHKARKPAKSKAMKSKKSKAMKKKKG